MYVYICMYTHIYVHIYRCIFLCTYIYAFACVYTGNHSFWRPPWKSRSQSAHPPRVTRYGNSTWKFCHALRFCSAARFSEKFVLQGVGTVYRTHRCSRVEPWRSWCICLTQLGPAAGVGCASGMCICINIFLHV